MNTPTMESPPAPQRRKDVSSTESTEATWRRLYQLGGAAALLAIALIVVAVGVFLIWPPPTSVVAWFALFQSNALRGLLDLDLMLVASYIVMIPLYLALYIALRKTSQTLMALALAFNLIAVALILAVNPGVAMLTLSGQYAAAATSAQQATYLAAGQALLTNWSGSSFVIGYLLSGLAILMTSVVMLRSATFGKLAAYIGIVTGALMLIPASAGTVGLWASLISLAPTAVWLVLVGMTLLRIGGIFGDVGGSFVVAHPRTPRTPRHA